MLTYKEFKQRLVEDIYRHHVAHIQHMVEPHLASVDLDDIRISGHLLDRANDAKRNEGAAITPQELADLLLKQIKINGKTISRLRDREEVTLADRKSRIFVGVQKDYKTLALKTIIRKNGMFRTSDRILSAY